MASHEYLRFILKTPKGYLTPTGATRNLCSKDIIVLNILEIGGFFSSKEKNVQNFLNLSTAKFNINECTVLYYACDVEEYYSCAYCPFKNYCNFWNNRKKCVFHEME